MRKFISMLFLGLIFSLSISAQKPYNPNSAEILLKIKKLNFLGTVLYVAAHPDDENTRLIAYLSNETLANTAYLSMTRGDGGQNLIGPEIREGLGVIRTQELLAARRIDGGRQFFTRANDFGYSKSTEETQKIWNREQVLSDVVWVYRNFKPDVIITRFPPDERAGHGHHTTSAIFAEEAFDLAADKNAYTDQLKFVEPWQVKRLFMNTGRWWSPDINEETPGVFVIDAGAYNQLLGTSYTEMAALSRSQHKSQGFGSTGQRGESLEFLEPVKGDKAEFNIFEGVDTSWKRVKGGEKIGKMIDEIIAEYNPQTPSASLPELLKVRDEILLLKEKHWQVQKLNEVDEIIKAVLGLYVETRAEDYNVSPGDASKLSIEVVNRSNTPVKLEAVAIDHLKDTITSVVLSNNTKLEFSTTVVIPESWNYSMPYWLKEEGTLGTYKVEDRALRGTPENAPAIEVSYAIEVLDHKIMLESPVIYKWNDPVKGEQYRPFIVTPPAFVNIEEPVYIFSGTESKKVNVTVKASKSGISGTAILNVPKGWKVQPENQKFELALKDEEAILSFDVVAPEGQSTGEISASISVGGKTYDNSIQTIAYDHIPTQVLMPRAASKVAKIDIKKEGNVIGYIQGAGDAIPASLREIGYEVWEMKDEEITPENLAKADAVVLGVRALNTNDRAKFYMPHLLNYVSEGGTLVVQYNTNFRLKTEEFAPYPLQLSRDRVTEEDAKIKILDPKNPLLNYPNKITEADFDGWVQERGLYFPDKWDEKYTPLLSSYDEGEDPKDGGLLVADYGKGKYIYTGYSFFRELPAGVPGAFRLFVNLVSAGKKEQPSNKKVSNSQK
ncbi:PIG-L family deacetylase [Fulvivirga sp.]|uniref:PIG-L family deacetylase n=1 Tax=Fulvivirga sp. TaxID=1931237 RepID=UPI0032EC0F0E